MPKLNFSLEEMKVYDLTLDLARGDFSLHVDKDKVGRKDLENYLRDTINKDILKGASLFQAYRRNNLVMFEIMEEIVNVLLQEIIGIQIDRLLIWEKNLLFRKSGFIFMYMTN